MRHLAGPRNVILKYRLLVGTLSLIRDYICNLEISFTQCKGGKMGRIFGRGGGATYKEIKKCGQEATNVPSVLSTW